MPAEKNLRKYCVVFEGEGDNHACEHLITFIFIIYMYDQYLRHSGGSKWVCKGEFFFFSITHLHPMDRNISLPNI